ncbi:MAG: DMT family transporter [Pseudomonadota bacterium]
MLLSLLLFSFMDASVKWLGADYPTTQIMFFRCSVALIPVIVIVAMRGGLKILKTDQKMLHLGRSLFGVTAMTFAFYAFSLMPLAEAISLLHTGPLFMTALSVVILREKVGIRRWTAVILGFIGMLIVVRPGPDMFSSGSFYMLVAATMIACSTIIVRILARHDDPVCITFYFTLAGTFASVVGLNFQTWVPPNSLDLGLLILVGLLGGMAQYFMTVSYRHVSIAKLSPLKYLTIAFGGIIGYLVWSEIPDLQAGLGIFIIVASGLYTLHREYHSHTRKAV